MVATRRSRGCPTLPELLSDAGDQDAGGIEGGLQVCQDRFNYPVLECICSDGHMPCRHHALSVEAKVATLTVRAAARHQPIAASAANQDARQQAGAVG